MTVTSRGTSNSNKRGNNEDRRRRREWLVETYASDQQMVKVTWLDGETNLDHDRRIDAWRRIIDSEDFGIPVVEAEPVATCRCYRCGDLLTADTVTVDRIVPGCLGGTYSHNNIRPACSKCNTETGAAMANLKSLRVAKMRARILERKCAYCEAGRGKKCRDANDRDLPTFHAPRRAHA